ncbi:YoeB-like toxin of type II toxin-antitoxin system [Enterocloster lavalensis]|uniref:YoeB-like toxin of type II toxin-antitoxin system n=1 Tax=Enterocloster lavalensis TaxID=460384 RepID=A0A1I0FH44_9FIRM|nr:YoeB-like toxin of type II toxin-antitoxin system [Enterocloster lavalensis]
MRLLWEDRAWNYYLYWQAQDKKTLKPVNARLRE